ncbi:general odorant-binding protein 72-like [Atheta coriaria]|uniref:general odorant-binding protein 72-like n=1 Tax=Dalotia coriaria TaxID=877792 RepID=UPI0031F35B19
MAANNILFAVSLLLLLTLNLVECNITEKQMKAAGKLIKNNCQPKSKATEEEITNMQKGIFSDSKSTKCYVLCTLTNMRVVKKTGEADWESAYSQAMTLPDSRVTPTIKSLDNCKAKLEFNDDKCDNAWRLGKCIYEDNPGNYFLP